MPKSVIRTGYILFHIISGSTFDPVITVDRLGLSELQRLTIVKYGFYLLSSLVCVRHVVLVLMGNGLK